MTKGRPVRNQGTRWILLVSTVLALMPGCLSTHDGYPKRPDNKPVFVSEAKVPGLNAPLPDQWERVFIGELPRPHLEGYMRTHATQKEDHELILHWVYDNEFRLAGVMTDHGKTTRFDHQGRPAYLGAFPTEEGLLAIFGHEDVAPVHLTTMPTPAN